MPVSNLWLQILDTSYTCTTRATFKRHFFLQLQRESDSTCTKNICPYNRLAIIDWSVGLI